MSSDVIKINTVDTTADKYDHAINLVDTTTAGNEDEPQQTAEGSWRRLARNPTRISVKDQLARRKYASWGKDKLDTSDGFGTEDETRSQPPVTAIASAHPENGESQTVDFGGRPQTARSNGKNKDKKDHSKHKRAKPESEVDVLYENQRGAFFCGIPLYSHSSLLNFDPAAWVTRDLRNSPVNITNAQVPDPSWVWAWKTWYVDMSHDVDEEGWQYSFSFGSKFAWHGTHPWLHSFVRRRRWLRKRVKRIDRLEKQTKESSMEAAHHLNTDYFTIHSKQRDRSPASNINPDAQLARPVSYTSIGSAEDEPLVPGEIKDIPSLMRTLRLATIDREKIDAIKLFIKTGGDELYYLKDNIPELMSQLVFQNSRRQILQFLRDEAEAAQKHREEHDAEQRPEGEDEKRHIDNLLQAAEVASSEISGLEYWSDRKHILPTEDDSEHDQAIQIKDVLGEIKGISEKAETSAEIRIDRRLINKGKEREQHSSSPPNEIEDAEREKPPLGKDSVLIEDEDYQKRNSDEAAWKGQTAKPVELDVQI